MACSYPPLDDDGFGEYPNELLETKLPDPTYFDLPEPDLPTSPSSSFSSPLSTPSLPHPPIPTAALTEGLYEYGERRGGERGERETSVASAQSAMHLSLGLLVALLVAYLF